MTSAFLDIETSRAGAITVLGIQVEGRGLPFIQLVAPTITRGALEGYLPRGTRLYTFNGHGFDVRVIRERLGIDLRERCDSVDLMRVCRSEGIAGRQVEVEKRLAGERFVCAWERPKPNAFDLWERWERRDRRALDELLAMNAADVAGLVQIRDAMLARGALQARFG